MRRDGFGEEHELFRAQVRRFVEREMAPKIAEWNARGMSDRETWRRAGEEGFLGVNAPEVYGGAGGDFLYDAIVMEELAAARAHGLMVSLHSDICLPYLTTFGSEEQKQKYAARRDPRRDAARHLHDRARHRLRPRRTCRRARSATATTTS